MRSEYQPLRSQEDDSGEEPRASTSTAPTRSQHRLVRAGSIDLTKLDNAFKRLVCCYSSLYHISSPSSWTESIAQKVKRKKKTPDHSRKQIWRSVFEPTIFPVSSSGVVCSAAIIWSMCLHFIKTKTLDHKRPMSQADFDAYVQIGIYTFLTDLSYAVWHNLSSTQSAKGFIPRW